MILGATMATKRVSQMSWKQLARCESFSEAEAKELKVRVARETMENAAALAQQRAEEEALREETALWEARLRKLEECERLYLKREARFADLERRAAALKEERQQFQELTAEVEQPMLEGGPALLDRPMQNEDFHRLLALLDQYPAEGAGGGGGGGTRRHGGRGATGRATVAVQDARERQGRIVFPRRRRQWRPLVRAFSAQRLAAKIAARARARTLFI